MTKNALVTTKVRFTSTSEMRAEGIRIASTGKALQADMHSLHMSIALHVATHGQIGVVNHYINQIAKVEGLRRNAVVSWFNAFAPVKYNEETKAFDHVKGKKFEYAKADAKPFWKFGAMEDGKEIKVMTIEQGIKSLIAKIKANREQTKTELSAEDQRMLSALTMMQSGIIPAEYQHTTH